MTVHWPINGQKVSASSRRTMTAFFFKKVLKRYDPELYGTQLTRVPKKLPVVLSQEEVEKLIEAAPNIRCPRLLLLPCLYSMRTRQCDYQS